jgi:hypothetical protein
MAALNTMAGKARLPERSSGTELCSRLEHNMQAKTACTYPSIEFISEMSYAGPATMFVDSSFSCRSLRQIVANSAVTSACLGWVHYRPI